ncbi:MAG: WYL domain-containing protein, partial [Planctomycetaceae bacterium]
TGYITERNWHPTQQQTLTPDGGVILEFDVSSLIEVRRWIMSWGAECQVLEPSELVIDIREQAQAILKQVKLKA